jgi:hypothetical protein
MIGVYKSYVENEKIFVSNIQIKKFVFRLSAIFKRENMFAPISKIEDAIVKL